MARDPSPRLLTSRLARRLEAHLVAAVLRQAQEAPTGRVLVIAPTRVGVDRVRRALLGAVSPGGAVAGVDVHHHHSLARDLLERAWVRGLRAAPPPRSLRPMELAELVRRAVQGLPRERALHRFCRERPRAVAALARTLGELREALVTPDELGAALPRDPDGLVEVHRAFVAMLEQLAAGPRPAADAAGLAVAAAGVARDGGEALPWVAAFHHGGYDLVGSQQALVAAIAARVTMTVTAPCGLGPAFETARRGLRRWPGGSALRGAVDLDEEAPDDVRRLDALFDEDAAPGSDASIQALHCRGTRVELQVALDRASSAHLERDVPLEDVGIFARSLEYFAGQWEDVASARGVPFSTTLGRPVARLPWTQAVLALLEALSEGLPRGVVMELLTSPWCRLASDGRVPDDLVPDLWDTWTRRAGILRCGPATRRELALWHRADLARRERRTGETVAQDEPWVALRARRLEALADTIERLRAAADEWTRQRGHAAHAAWLRRTVSRWIATPDAEDAEASAACEAFHDVADTIARVDDLPGDAAARAPTPRSVRRLVVEGLSEATTPLAGASATGVRFLDFMQSRAQPFRETVLVGFNQGVTPRRARADPFLPDAARARLREQAGRPVTLRDDAVHEERLLLALALGASDGPVTITWQRADEDGRVRAPSLHLREVARLAGGRPDLAALTGPAGALPVEALSGHPARAAAALREASGLATWPEACQEVADRPRRGGLVSRLAEATGRGGPDLERALSALRTVDAFRDVERAADAAGLAHDGLLGPDVVAVPDSLSATSVEGFGRCALRWFFERGLHLAELESPAEDLDVEATEVGLLVHDVLERAYADALRTGGDAAAVRGVLLEGGLDGHWRRRFGSLAGGRRDEAPLYWDALDERWLSAVRAFVERDAERLAEDDARVVAVETPLEAAVDLADGRPPWVLTGRVDRIVETPDGYRIEDYKTTPSVDARVQPAAILRGEELQGLVYWLAARRWAGERGHPRTEAPDVQVAFVPVHPEAPGAPARRLEIARHEAAALETLAVLRSLLQDGAFPLREGGHCQWCSFRMACRRAHVPTRARLAGAPALRDHAALSGKSTRRPFVRDVMASGGESAGEAP